MQKFHPTAAERQRARELRAANPAMAAAVAEIYRSSRATPHKDRRAAARNGLGRGGRAGAKAALRAAVKERF
ncbi:MULTISPECIES: hypothetical protein [Kocuria]|uniref:hypothetical protein n=1 Tax=Kocuria TaxID=57493 RepID=UPI000738D71C|nr:hypothetical protein [Kocuria palustris]KUG54830.1 hypothetical protein AVL60_00225 [Kocuria palustris]